MAQGVGGRVVVGYEHPSDEQPRAEFGFQPPAPPERSRVMTNAPTGYPTPPTTGSDAIATHDDGKTITPSWEPDEEDPQIVRDPETVPLLEQVQAGQVMKVRSTEVVQVGKEDPEHSFTLQIAAPHETAEKVMALMNSGAAVFAVVGVRQYRFGAAPPEPD